MALNIIIDAAFPTVSFALTGGPSQPEFTSFEPIATTDMVNEYTGDFTYNLPVINIPGGAGGGYALSLSYHSGTTMEEEASWVGYGWTLNPGSINRSKIGYPDDWNGQSVNFWNKNIPSNTITVGGNIEGELYSIDVAPGLDLNASLRYNNYKGFGYGLGAGISLGQGIVSVGFNVNDGTGSYSYSLKPVSALNYKANLKDKKERSNNDIKFLPMNYLTKEGQAEYHKGKRKSALKNAYTSTISTVFGSSYGIFSFGQAERPVNITTYSGTSYKLQIGANATPSAFEVGVSTNLWGKYSVQTNVPNETANAYGYLYSENTDYTGRMDYHTEKANTYNKQDLFLGIPVSNSDQFIVTGEGLGGAFKAYKKSIGHFRPNNSRSNTIIIEAGGEVEAGMNWGGGANIQTGQHYLDVKPWPGVYSSFSATSNENIDEPIFFRFNNDLGGYVEYGSDEKQQAGLNQTHSLVGFKEYEADITEINTQLNGSTTSNPVRSGRSSNISYSFNKEIKELMGGVNYKAYEKDEIVLGQVERNNDLLDDQLGEFSITNEDGMIYNYGLPVYARGEMNLSVNLPDGYVLESNNIVYSNATAFTDTKIGTVSEKPYATTFLLTSIVSPDYIDRTNDGPTEDDFGSYVKFEYDRKYGSYEKEKTSSSDTTWYKWRMPYNGQYFQRGELSDPKDNMGYVSEGEKEIYFLDEIETKTHVARFIKSDEFRTDGLGAVHNRHKASSDENAKGTQKLDQLDKIELYSKNGASEKLIKTVNFDYSQSLCNGILNGNTGKLTLERVWFDYEGIYNAKVSPYIFGYEYPNVDYPTIYDDLEMKDSYVLTDENPGYNIMDIDPWGFYQLNGTARKEDMKTWVNQNPAPGFDPAAWQLKQIILPSGGEIHIQYEQKDYCYVQDKMAHVMVPLTGYNSSTGYCTIDCAELGLDDSEEKSELVNTINSMYVLGKKRMYFKFLYRLVVDEDNEDVEPEIVNCNAEYITGYVYVKGVDIETISGNVRVQLGKPSGLGDEANDVDYFLPEDVCKDYVKTQKVGNVLESGDCACSTNNVFEDSDPVNVADRFLSFISTNFSLGSTCMKINNSLSYLRVPSVKNKLGGGVRVKRLLMYDKGIEHNTEVLLGNEYFYRFYDQNLGKYRSSGVATTEPQDMREENILVDILERGTQTWVGKVLSGRDKEQSEGPLGESLLPAPTVGYSRVIVNNIHSGITAPGFSIREYYTPKSNPIKCDRTEIKTERDRLTLFTYFLNRYVNSVWLTQGYKFEVSGMPGNINTSTTYSGSYTYDTESDTETLGKIVASERYNYFEQGEELPVLTNIKQLDEMNSWSELPTMPLGKEMDLAMESRRVKDYYQDISAEFDASLGFLVIAPFPLPSGFIIVPIPQYTIVPIMNFQKSEINTHVTSKVIHYPATIKSIEVVKDGVRFMSENKAFDPNTGKPIITVNYDGFHNERILGSNHNGAIVSYSIPASHEYPLMGQKAFNDRKKYVSETADTIIFKQIGSNYYIEFTNDEDNCDASKGLSSGDLVKLNNLTETETAVCHIGEIFGNSYQVLPTYYSNSISSWDEDLVNVKIIKSGRTNQLSAMAGSVSVYGDPSKMEIEITDEFDFTDRESLATELDGSSSFTANPYKDILVNPVNGSCGIPSGYTIVVDNTDPDTVSVKLKDAALSVVSSSCLFDSGSTYDFTVDPLSGQLLFYSSENDCNPQYIECLQFCTDSFAGVVVKNALTTSAQTFNDYWPYDENKYFPEDTTYNVYESGTKGKWRPQTAYSYRDSIIGIISDSTLFGKNYNSGLSDIEFFNWKIPTANNSDKWLPLAKTTKYTPDGNAVEEENIMGIKSMAKYGYNGTLAYLVSANSDYEFSIFESFEKVYTYGSDEYFEDGLEHINSNRDQTIAHSGFSSLKFDSATDTIFSLNELNRIDANELYKRGAMFKVWVKTNSENPSVVENNLFAKIKDDSGDVLKSVKFKKVAQVGEWTLYQAVITGFTYSGSEDVIPSIVYNFEGTEDIWLDDVAFHPLDGSISAFVYDVNTHRLLTSFDDQHFGLFYQYNAEGKLIRKQIETEKGLKTIQETQYNNSSKVDR